LLAYVRSRFTAQLQLHTFPAAGVLAGLTLLTLGVLKVRVTGRNWLMSGLGMLVVGGITAVAAYGIGRGLSGLA
jgi:VIT1/CCC1 family predicted Fe2+/Mn2+ transporter